MLWVVTGECLLLVPRWVRTVPGVDDLPHASGMTPHARQKACARLGLLRFGRPVRRQSPRIGVDEVGRSARTARRDQRLLRLDSNLQGARFFRFLCVVVGVTSIASHVQGAGRLASDSPKRFRSAATPARLNEVLRAIDDSNAPSLIGSGRWSALVAQHREAIESARSHALFAAAVNHLIADAGVSHFAYYTDEDWDYWHLRSTFGDGSPSERVDHIGIVPQRIEGRWFVRGILEGSVANDSELRVGDELLTVNGLAFSPIDAFRGTAGRTTRLRVRRRPGLIYNIDVRPIREPLYDAMQRAIIKSIAVVEHHGLLFAYLHGWTLLGRGKEYEALAKLQDDVDGLLLDYRDGFGGTWQRAERFLVGSGDDRRGPSRPPTWIKPVVILTGDGTRSAKEIVVDAVKRTGRAPLIGEATPGHVTSVGGVVAVGEDGLLLLPGQKFSLEGNPVVPDFPMDREIRYSAGADPQMALAKEVLAGLVRQRVRPPTLRRRNGAAAPVIGRPRNLKNRAG